MKKILPIILLSSMFFFPIKVEEKEMNYRNDGTALLMNIDYNSLEGLIALNSLQGDTKGFNLFDSLKNERELSKKVDSLTSFNRDTLKEMVKKNTNRFIRWNKYAEGLYKKYGKLNDSICSIKKSIPAYDLFFDKGGFYLKGKEKILLDKEEGYELLKNLEKLEKVSDYPSFSRVLEYIPLILQNSRGKEDFLSNLSLIINESNGFSYITGHSGDINLAQINPSIISGLYYNLRKGEGASGIERIARSNNLSDFRKLVKEEPRVSLLCGIYLFDLLKKDSKTESQAVLSYMVGPGGYYNVPKSFRDRIEGGRINSKEDITERESQIKEMNYLKRYYYKKEIYSTLLKFIE